MDLRQEFHVDSHLPKEAALDGGAEAPRLDLGSRSQRCRNAMNGLANLQLLEGTQNIQKSDTLPTAWARDQFPDESARRGWLAGHDMHDLPEDVEDFVAFFDARRLRMSERISRVLIG